jgi:hypothetical protein
MQALAAKYGATVAASSPLSDKGFFSTIGDDIVSGAKKIWNIPAEVAAGRAGSDLTAMGQSLTQGRKDAWQQAKDAYAKGNYKEAAEHALGAFPVLGPPFNEAMNEARMPAPGASPDATHQGKTGEGLAHGVEAAAPYVAPELARQAATAISGGSNVVSGAMDADPAVAMTRALKPSPNNADFTAGLPDAMADIKTHGGEVVNNEALKANSKVAMNKAQAALENWMQPARSAGVTANGNPIVQASADALPETMWLEDPKTAQGLMQSVSKAYSRDFTVDQLRQLLKEKNAELSSFYDKSTGKQNATVTSGAPQAVVKAQRDAIADTLYKALDPRGQGAGPREIQARYGAMKELADAADKRTNAINAEKPVSTAGAVTSTAAALADIPGKVLQGKTEEALSGVTAPFRGTSDPLIKRAFANVGDAPPFPIPPTQQATNLLTTGSIVTPAPADTSFVRGAQGMNQPLNPARALPAPSTITPPSPPDTSFVRLVPLTAQQAAQVMPKALPPGTAPFSQGTIVPDIAGKPGPMTGRMIEAGPQPPVGGPRLVPPTDTTSLEILDAAKAIARDPRTGRMFRYYTSDSDANAARMNEKPVIDAKAASPGPTSPKPERPREPAPTGPPPGATVSVAAPDGSVHWFTNQQSADMFKQLAGIK